MAHEIDQTTGKAAVFVTGEPAWHKLGVVVSQAQTSAEAVRLAGLDWEVRKQPLLAQIRGGQTMPVNGYYATVRQDTQAVLGVVGSHYQPFQNAAAFDFMDALVGEKLAMFETAGSLKNGKRVWMMARVPGELRAAKDDVVTPYILLTNSHDGTSALRMIPTSVRVVCQNTLNMALCGAGSQGVTIRHSVSLSARVEEARRNLGIVAKGVEKFQEQITILASKSLTDGQAAAYFKQVLGIREPKQSAAPAAGLLDSILAAHGQQQEVMGELLAGHKEQTARQEKADARLLEQVLANYHDATNTLPGIAGTAWAAYNAVSEYTDHQSRVQGKTERERVDNRLNSIWFGRGDDIKQEAFKAALQLAV